MRTQLSVPETIKLANTNWRRGFAADEIDNERQFPHNARKIARDCDDLMSPAPRGGIDLTPCRMRNQYD